MFICAYITPVPESVQQTASKLVPRAISGTLQTSSITHHHDVCTQNTHAHTPAQHSTSGRGKCARPRGDSAGVAGARAQQNPTSKLCWCIMRMYTIRFATTRVTQCSTYNRCARRVRVHVCHSIVRTHVQIYIHGWMCAAQRLMCAVVYERGHARQRALTNSKLYKCRDLIGIHFAPRYARYASDVGLGRGVQRSRASVRVCATEPAAITLRHRHRRFFGS